MFDSLFDGSFTVIAPPEAIPFTWGKILERVMHVERSAGCMAIWIQRHPGVRRDPDPGDRLDSRVRGNDHDAASVVC